MTTAWEEVRVARAEKRYELVLSGSDISTRIAESGIDKTLFSLNHLNFLEISKVALQSLSDELGNLSNLNHLVLHSNNLEKLPNAIGQLTKLKVIDVSRNQLKCLPDEICQLTLLLNINFSGNQLSQLPSDFTNLKKIVTLDLSHNRFESFPLECSSDLTQLSEIKMQGNKIKNIPVEIHSLASLKLLDLEDNEVDVVPGELGECGKLKDFNLKGNNLKDRRLKKLVDQCHAKQVLEYIRSHCPKSNVNSSSAKETKGKKSSKGKKKGVKDDTEKLQDQMQVLHVTDTTPVVVVTSAIHTIRPYILCCIIRNVNFESNINFKKFISLQTRLHEQECNNRKLATIATHDLSKLGEKLLFDARPPDEIKLIPLKLQKEITAGEYYDQLRKEADSLRKVKNRNTFCGLHKYLYLLDNQPLFPCLISEERVISFPPITNSDLSKISSSTQHIFVEVTSSTSLGVCKKILDQLLLETLRSCIGDKETNSTLEMDRDGLENQNDLPNTKSLIVEQVKIVDEIGQLRAVYPSRTDLQWDDVQVIRSFD